MRSRQYLAGAIIYTVVSFLLFAWMLVDENADIQKTAKIKQQQEIIYTLQSDLVTSIENSLDRTNALAASNYGKIKKLEEHFGLSEVEE